MEEGQKETHYIGSALKEGRGEGKGWFIASWQKEAVKQTKEIEMAIKRLRPGDKELPHTHTSSTEVCLVIKGKWPIEVNGEKHILGPGEYLLSKPGSVLSWEIPPDSKPVRVIVVRAPSIDDKVPVNK